MRLVYEPSADNADGLEAKGDLWAVDAGERRHVWVTRRGVRDATAVDRGLSSWSLCSVSVPSQATLAWRRAWGWRA